MTRIAVISDIHSNIEALTAVLKDAKQKECTQIRCLGDLVDYGPDPRKVVGTIMKQKIPCAMGNHEQMVLGERRVHERLESTVDHSRKKLTKKQLAFLRTLPTTIEEDDILYVHAAPVQGKSREVRLRTGTLENKPELATYLLVSEDYDQVKNLLPVMFDNFKRICFVGHTHMPILAGLTKKNSNAL